jgi:hypothetical protein
MAGELEDKKKLDRYVKSSNRDSGVELEEKLALANGRKAASKKQVQHEQQLAFFGLDQKPMRRRLQEAGELADQYKREARGKEEGPIRSKIRQVTGFAKGGSVRGTGAATRGKKFSGTY